jgi:uncharacterized RDD family membrane protein YckC
VAAVAVLFAMWRTREVEVAGQMMLHAPLPRRFVAVLIDMLVVATPYFVIAGLLLDGYMLWRFNLPLMNPLAAVGYLAMGWLFGLILLGVLGLFEGVTGRTPGKLLMGLWVVRRSDGQVAGAGRGLGRWMLMIADGFAWGLVGLLLVSINRYQGRLGDIACGTVVVAGPATKTL